MDVEGGVHATERGGVHAAEPASASAAEREEPASPPRQPAPAAAKKVRREGGANRKESNIRHSGLLPRVLPQLGGLHEFRIG